VICAETLASKRRKPGRLDGIVGRRVRAREWPAPHATLEIGFNSKRCAETAEPCSRTAPTGRKKMHEGAERSEQIAALRTVFSDVRGPSVN
jgi:hypothetical protein